MKVIDIYNFLDSIAPFNTALPFDNAGLLVGEDQKEVKKIGVVLDVTPEALDFAQKHDIDLIVSHHPVIFHPLKALTADSVQYKLAAGGVSVISAHTNLDAAVGGVNDALCETLELHDVSPLADPQTEGFPPMGRKGRLDRQMSCEDFAKLVSQKLCTKAKTVISHKKIQTVAVCGGAGEDFILPAVKSGADALVTADIKHHNLLLAKSLGLCLIDAGHFETENVVVPRLAKRISEFSSIETAVIPQSPPAKWF